MTRREHDVRATRHAHARELEPDAARPAGDEDHLAVHRARASHAPSSGDKGGNVGE